MAVTHNSYTGNGSTTNYSFTFPYLKSTDIQVQLDAVVQATNTWSLANATTVQFNTAPANGVAIKILRDTNVDNLTATFYAGSAIKSEDLNDNFTQSLYVAQEVETISPGIVYESEDLEKGGVSKGTTTKGVKYSILYMKAIKALQEAMEKIETLETKVAALEAK